MSHTSYRAPRRRSIRLRGYDYARPGIYFITICADKGAHLFGKVVQGEMIPNAFGRIVLSEWEKIPARWPHVELGVYQVMPNHFHGILIIHQPVAMVLVAQPVANAMDATAAISATARVAATGDGGIKNATHRPLFRVRATLAVAPAPIAPAPIAPFAAPPPFPPSSQSFELIPFSKTQWATRPTLGQIIGAYKSLVETTCLKYYKQQYPGKRMGKIFQRSYYDMIARDQRAFLNFSRYIINNPKNWTSDKFFGT